MVLKGEVERRISEKVGAWYVWEFGAVGEGFFEPRISQIFKFYILAAGGF